MRKPRLNCSRDRLISELCRWHSNWNDRSSEFERFGQRIWNIYGDGCLSWPELFYEKDTKVAFSLAFKEIEENCDD